MLKVRNIGSNQTQVHVNDRIVILVSYETPVAAHVEGRGYFRTSQYHSNTTSKHIARWLGDAKDRAAVRSPEWFESLVQGNIQD